MASSKIDILGHNFNYGGGFLFQTPAASPALAGVGFIVGLRVAAVLFAGAVMGWLFLVPGFLFLNPALADIVTAGNSWVDVNLEVWKKQVRPLAVGTMIVAAFYTLYNLRNSLTTGIKPCVFVCINSSCPAVAPRNASSPYPSGQGCFSTESPLNSPSPAAPPATESQSAPR